MFVEERKSRLTGIDYFKKEVLDCKLDLLSDDAALGAQLKLLDFLVKDQKLATPPNVVDLIRWRRCGVVRWLVEQSYIDLGQPANLEEQLARRRDTVTFHGEEGVPVSMTTLEFLVFLSIECDDLQTMQWLVQSQNVPVERITCNGCNVVHACACYGRSEIFLWLLRESNAQALLVEPCGRRPWSKLYAAHLAILHGFLFLAELLLASGSPFEDTAGNPIDRLARQSSYAFVQNWGESQHLPIVLANEIQALNRLLTEASVNEDEVKQHIVETNCLSVNRWTECGCCKSEFPGPLGLTYIDVVSLCCEKMDCDRLLWLLQPLLSKDDFFMTLKFLNKSDRLPWRSFLVDDGDDIVSRYFGKPWMPNETSTLEPLELYPILRKLTHLLQDQPRKVLILEDIRSTLARVAALETILRCAGTEAKRLLSRGASVDSILEICNLFKALASELTAKHCRDVDSLFRSCILSVEGKLRLDYSFYPNPAMEERDILQHHMIWHGKSSYERCQVYSVLAAEGYAELIAWSLQPERNCWDAEKEIDVIRTASVLGHAEVVDLFLDRQTKFSFFSTISERMLAAILGAAEAGRIEDLEFLLGELDKSGLTLNPLILDKNGRTDESFYQQSKLLSSSLAGSTLFRYMSITTDPMLPATTTTRSRDDFALLKWICLKANVSNKEIVLAANFTLQSSVTAFASVIGLLEFLIHEMSLNLWMCREEICDLSRTFQLALDSEGADSVDFKNNMMRSLVTLVADTGFDIQLLPFSEHRELWKVFSPFYEQLQVRQMELWSKLDVVKKGGTLAEIQEAVDSKVIGLSSRDSSGLLLTHLAAAYDRVDVLSWLVTARGASLEITDGYGRNVRQVAEVSNSMSCVDWISRRHASDIVSSFVSSRVRSRAARKWVRTVLCHITRAQSLYRGYRTRLTFRGRLLKRLEHSHRFQVIWQRSLQLLGQEAPNRSEITWISMKRMEHDTVRTTDLVTDVELAKTAETLGNAMSNILSETTELIEYSSDDELAVTGPDGSRETESSHHLEAPRFDSINLTKEVLKWLRVADSKFRGFFIRRIRQLACGDRGRTLTKRLTGCRKAVYESYLEQKSGQRILWTESSNRSILIWYVAKHDNVSRLASLIDNAEDKSRRQLALASELPEIEEDTHREESGGSEFLMLDPLGDTPLKLYDVPYEEIGKLEDATWQPRLHLTPNENEIVRTKGTVLLLGRSGTGKTCCICNRMDYDRHVNDGDVTFSQLFVSRSDRLCHFVKDAVGDSLASTAGVSRIKFTSFRRLVESLESCMPDNNGSSVAYLPSHKVDFGRFKRDAFGEFSGIDALITWVSIRSFIKGSIEAVQRRRPLTREEYMNLGSRRCRLTPEQRSLVYGVYERYEKVSKDLALFDDCDRIAALIYRMQDAKNSDSPAFEEARCSKIYVDEVQDYTQSEIALFFYLSGPGSLFLAGDPAQSVVEGVEFRFEDIRSVGHHLCGNDNRALIPDKPKTVNINFRSHSGILNVAAGVLSVLFGAFPNAAKQLSRDRGLFKGPRPAIFQKVDILRLKELILKLDGVVVLTHDKESSKMRRDLLYPLVYGIRESKGLEFHGVVLVNFFADLPLHLQKPVRDLFLARDCQDVSTEYPEIEGVLKLFYTGITRCIQRLFFVETRRSVSGDGFLRWISATTKGQSGKEALAMLHTGDTIEKMTRTPDEWRSAGIDNAVIAESSRDEPEKAALYLEKAIYCFDQIGDTELAKKARVHRLSALFCAELYGDRANDDSHCIELDAASMVEKLLSERLHGEVSHVCEAVMPRLAVYVQDRLKERLLSRLPISSDL